MQNGDILLSSFRTMSKILKRWLFGPGQGVPVKYDIIHMRNNKQTSKIFLVFWRDAFRRPKLPYLRN